MTGPLYNLRRGPLPCRGLTTGMAKGQRDGWPKAGRGYEGLLSGEATCKEEMKGQLEVDGLYKGKSGPWRGRRMAYPSTTYCLLVNPTGLDYCI